MKMRKCCCYGLFGVLLIMGCASTKQKEQAPAPVSLSSQAEEQMGRLSGLNPTLADELLKLPELRRGLDAKGELALTRIVALYTETKNPQVPVAFDRLLSIGKKDHRKFSAPLQALFWYAEDNELPLDADPLKCFSNLEYKGFNSNLGEDKETVLFVYGVWKNTCDTPKWNDAKEIADRLTSPHLFDIFFRDNIKVNLDLVNAVLNDFAIYGTWPIYQQPADVTISKRRGTPSNTMQMATEVLGAAGYDVGPLQVVFSVPANFGWRRSYVAVLKENGSYYKMADLYRVQDGILGPFKSLGEVAEKVAQERKLPMLGYAQDVGLLPWK